MSVPLKVDDYLCPMGIMFFGGCGSSILSQTVVNLKPADYPNFHLFAADTDARTHIKHFLKEESEARDLWVDEGALTLHSFGGKEITGGKGAGTNPEVGRKAAESEGSMKAMRGFLDKVEAVLLVGSVSGGTGTGSLPVAAKLAVEMNKLVMAFVVTPGRHEGRTERAKKALREIKGIVPTFTVRNEYLSEFLDRTITDPEKRRKITPRQGWRLMDKSTIIPMLLILREIIQVTGDVNFDLADLQTQVSYGNDLFLGFAEVQPSRYLEYEPEQLANTLCTSPFQDESIVNRGEAVSYFTHGPWSEQVVVKVSGLLTGKVLKDRGDNRELEIIPGSIDDTDDGRMWMAVLVTAKTREEKNEKALESFEAEDANEAKGRIRYNSHEVPQELRVSSAFATQFNQLHGSIKSSREQLEALYDEVEKRGGTRPDLPLRFREKAPARRPGIKDFFAALGFKQKMV